MKRLAAALLTLALAVPACGDEDTVSPGGSPMSATATPAGDKPVVTVPSGAPPAQLVIEDITVGTGEEAKAGARVSVHYVGVAYSSGKQFDASWDRGQPFSFQLGAGRVIAGWDQGVAGMKEGGRRKLTIPPSLGYGDRGAGDLIKPGETLIFVVDLLDASA